MEAEVRVINSGHHAILC